MGNIILGFTRRQNWHYDITKSLEGMTPDSKPSISVSDDQILSFVNASFIFRDEEGKAGQTAYAQLSLTSNAHQGSAPVVFKDARVTVTGSVTSIILENKADDASPDLMPGVTRLVDVALSNVVEEVEDSSDDDSEESNESSESDKAASSLKGEAPLTLYPGQTLVYSLEVPLREPGQASAVSIELSLETDAFDLKHSLDFDDRTPASSNRWYMTGTKTKRVARANPLSLKVLPRPPKMEILNPTWKTQYYTNEPLDLDFDLLNQEDVDAPAKLDVVLSGEEVPPSLFNLEVSGQKVHKTPTALEGAASVLSLSGVSLGSIASSKSLGVRVRLPPVERTSDYTLTLRVVYHLSTDPGTPIIQEKALPLTIVNPFEANYDLLPRIHPDPWPSLFDSDGVQVDDPSVAQIPKGLSQTWQLVTRHASFASEPLRILDVDIMIQAPPSTRVTHSKVDPSPAGGEGRIIRPRTMEEASFEIVARKNTLDDRSPVALDVSLVIKWARLSDSEPDTKQQGNITTLPVPRFNIFGTEPRVLASVSYLNLPSPSSSSQSPSSSPTDDAPSHSHQQILLLTITIENASNHFLTFGLSMDAPISSNGESEFAFSGAKQTTMNMLPVSRRSIDYRILPLVSPPPAGGEEGESKNEGSGAWIKPHLVVRDKYFQKVLRIIPAGEGMKLDKESGGVLIWVPFLR